MNFVQKAIQSLVLAATGAGSLFIGWMLGSNANGAVWAWALAAFLAALGVFLLAGAVTTTLRARA